MTDAIVSDTAFTTGQLFFRVGMALFFGLILGIDRELRGIAAGLRTHALVCTSACIITLSALDLYIGVRAAGGDADPLRVI